VENKFGNDVAKIDLDVLGKPERYRCIARKLFSWNFEQK